MPPSLDYIHLPFTRQEEDDSFVIRNVIYIMKFIFMPNAKKQNRVKSSGGGAS